ncbi:MAG: hypothetical protein V8R51_04965 [Clostridia bacterium]
MMMEIVLSEEKAEINNVDINECYNKIDRYFISRGVKKEVSVFIKGQIKILVLLLVHKLVFLTVSGF